MLVESMNEGQRESRRPRRSGIQSLDEVPWGSHLCLFYETKQDLLDLLVPYFRAGFEGEEFCVWAASPPLSIDEAKQALAAGIPDFDSRLAARDIEIVRCPDLSLPGGRIDPRRITAGWHRMVQEALDRGYQGMRISGNAFWIGTDYWSHFTDYENELDQTLAGKPMLLACTYQLDKSEATDLLDVARAHGVTIALRRGVWEHVEAALSERDDHPLTERETEVLGWVANGKSAWEIGEILGITKRTVDHHVENAVEKLGAANRTHAVAIAIRDRIVRLTDLN